MNRDPSDSSAEMKEVSDFSMVEILYNLPKTHYNLIFNLETLIDCMLLPFVNIHMIGPIQY